MGFKKQRVISVQTDLQKEYSGTQELVNGEEGLRGYNRDIVKKMASGLGLDRHKEGPTSSVVEFGAGTGTLAEVWRDEFKIDPICLEIDPLLISMLENKGFRVLNSIEAIPSQVSILYTSNVLEHIKDDVDALEKLRIKMEFGGKIAIYVPALPWLFSDLDRKVGHFRRYGRKELIKKVQTAGFEVNDCFYNDSLGVLAWGALKIFGYNSKKGLGANTTLVLYNNFIYPISKFLDSLLFKHLVGKNIFLFATNSKL